MLRYLPPDDDNALTIRVLFSLIFAVRSSPVYTWKYLHIKLFHTNLLLLIAAEHEVL